MCIDAVPLLLRSAGIKNYLYHWVRQMQKSAGYRVKLFPYLDNFGELNHQGSVSDRIPTLARLALLHLLNTKTNQLADWVLPATDVFHTCKLLNPPQKTRVTATLHDLTCFLMPEFHTAANVKAEKYFADRILRRADGVIAVSENTRQDAIRCLGLNPDRIEVIHHGVADAYFDISPGDVEHARRRYRLERPYVLFVGMIEPRKNIARLLDAYESLAGDIRAEFELVIAGPMGWNPEQTIGRLQTVASGVRYLGYVPETLLPALFGGAVAFAYVSLYEGFGFPVAQAMAAGVPVVTSAVSSLPEVTGGAAELVDPHSVESIRSALYRLLTSPSRRVSLSVGARRRAECFRWENCARQSLQFFENVAGRCHGLS